MTWAYLALLRLRDAGRVVESPAMQQYLERMKREEIQQLYKQRQKVAEFPHLWMKSPRGWQRFQVGATAKAAKEAIWRAVAYNIEQWTRVRWIEAIGQSAARGQRRFSENYPQNLSLRG